MRIQASVLLAYAMTPTVWSGGVIPPEDFRIAFVGDQGLTANSQAVLQLIADENTDVVVHSGDFDYEDDPQAWDQQITSFLGPCFPYFASVGNHDDSIYYGAGGYQELLEARMDCLRLSWDGDLGVRSSHHYQGIFFVHTAPNLFGDGDTVHAPYIRDQLAADESIWSISSWHVLMRAMQVGGKNDQSGWGVYEETRRGGAIVATGHEHSYGRTHALSNCSTQTVVSAENTIVLTADDPDTPDDEGVTFVHYNGLAGRGIRDQERCLPTGDPYGCNGEWASIYAEQQGAEYGALFGVFHVDGDPCLAHFYFKDISGAIIDDFYTRSTLGPCPCAGDVTGDAVVDILDFLTVLANWGEQSEGPADIDGDGIVGLPEYQLVIALWGRPCR